MTRSWLRRREMREHFPFYLTPQTNLPTGMAVPGFHLLHRLSFCNRDMFSVDLVLNRAQPS